MEIYFVTIGLYEDYRVIGLATSEAEAKDIADKARADVDYESIRWFAGMDDTIQVHGPQQANRLIPYGEAF